MKNTAFTNALKKLEKAAEQGNLSAAHLAGKCYFDIFKKTKNTEHLTLSLEWHEKAANLKDNNIDYQIECKLAYMEAVFLLSDLGFEGIGTEYAGKAVYWGEVINDRLDSNRLSYLVSNINRIFGC